MGRNNALFFSVDLKRLPNKLSGAEVLNSSCKRAQENPKKSVASFRGDMTQLLEGWV